MKKRFLPIAVLLFAFQAMSQIYNPNTAPWVPIDRFSDSAGHLQVRSTDPSLPAANAPINFDVPPFITLGIGPSGQHVKYYNFDIQPTVPAPIYVLYRVGETSPVSGQGGIVNTIPGQPGYNDFWQIINVTVPVNYVANTIASLDSLTKANYPMTVTNSLFNGPIVPHGSTASLNLSGNPDTLVWGWYQNQVVFWFVFAEKALVTTSSGNVPVAPIYVTFNINPGMTGGGPPSGFVMEAGSQQTHNVISALPSDSSYSPLWWVDVYDNVDFDSVSNLATAEAATLLVNGAGNVNCPVVAIMNVTAGLANGYIAANTLDAYPNPAISQLTVSLSNSSVGNGTVAIVNALGSNMVTYNENLSNGFQKTYDISNLPSGMYTVTINANGSRFVKKILKQ